jgi:hypothetical protein
MRTAARRHRVIRLTRTIVSGIGGLITSDASLKFAVANSTDTSAIFMLLVKVAINALEINLTARSTRVIAVDKTPRLLLGD